MSKDHLNQYRTTLEQDEYKAKKIKDFDKLTKKELALLVASPKTPKTYLSRHAEMKRGHFRMVPIRSLKTKSCWATKLPPKFR